MDELTLLRELETDAPPMTPRARYLARMRLRYEIAYERRAARGPLAGPIVAVAAAAAAMGAVIVVIDHEAAAPPEPRIQLTSATPALLLAAEAAGAEATGPIPRDDQYIYRRDVTEERPLDGKGETRTFVDESWMAADGSGPSRNSELGKVWTTRGEVWPPVRYEELKRLPTDPGRLLLGVRALPGHGPESDEPMSADDYETAYMYLSFLLYRSQPMPPGLRAAAFEALARIPDVQIVDDRVDARGRRGIAISRADPRRGQELILDATTHEYLGFRNTDVRDDGERVERVSSRVESGVVDRIGERP